MNLDETGSESTELTLTESPSFTEDHLASQLAALVNALALPTTAGSGPSFSEWWEKLDHVGWLQKIPALSSQSGLLPEVSSMQSRIRWPRWGIVSAGKHTRPALWERHTDGNAPSSSVSSWATPRASPGESRATKRTPAQLYRGHGEYLAVQALESATPTPVVPNGGRRHSPETSDTGMTPEGKKRQMDLAEIVRRTEAWPTPTASQPGQGDPNDPQRGKKLTWAVSQAEMWPTPKATEIDETLSSYLGRKRMVAARGLGPSLTVAVKQQDQGTPRASPSATDHKGSATPDQRRGQLSSQVAGRRLNPEWTAQLMGLPADYLALPTLSYSHSGRQAEGKRSTPTKRCAPSRSQSDVANHQRTTPSS